MPDWVTEATVIAAIAQIGAILIAVVGGTGAVIIAIVNRTRQHAKAAATSSRAAAASSQITQEEVRNNHVDAAGVPINMRDEFDDRFEESQRAQEEQRRAQVEILKALDQLGIDLRGTRRDVGRLADADIESARRMTQLAERLDRHMSRSDQERDTIGHKMDEIERTIPKSELEQLQKRESNDPK